MTRRAPPPMPGLGRGAPVSKSHLVLVGCIALLSASAWLALWGAGDSLSFLSHEHHHRLGHHGGGALLDTLLPFIAGWTVMTVAMMLPTSLPVLAILHTLAGERKDRPLLVSLATTGYLAAWTSFGGIAWAAGSLLERALPAELSAHVSGGVLLLLAGAFQFSSLKYRCLDKCRSPMTFVIGRWRGRRQRWEAFRLGWEHGLFCVGCCWALMLLMFAVGTGSLAWMFVLAIVMAVEKNVAWGRRISAPVGTGLLGWGALSLAGVA